MQNTKSKLVKIIKHHFPHLTWKSAKYVSVGMDHDVIILDNKTVFRFPKKGDSKKLLQGEVNLLKIIASKVSVVVPSYTFAAKDYSCTAYPFVKGEGFTVKSYNKLSLVQKKKLTKQIGIFLTELHSTPLSKIKNCNVRERFAEQELKKLHKDAKKYLYPNFSTKEKESMDIFFSELKHVLYQKYKKVLVHGDLSGEHLLLDKKNNLVGVIDFADRAIHDPAFDFIRLWKFGKSFVELIYSEYGGKKEGILERSKVYAKASAIWNMVEAVKEKKKVDYKKWYRRLKQLDVRF